MDTTLITNLVNLGLIVATTYFAAKTEKVKSTAAKLALLLEHATQALQDNQLTDAEVQQIVKDIEALKGA
jgi:hypothetical protein